MRNVVFGLIFLLPYSFTLSQNTNSGILLLGEDEFYLADITANNDIGDFFPDQIFGEQFSEVMNTSQSLSTDISEEFHVSQQYFIRQITSPIALETFDFQAALGIGTINKMIYFFDVGLDWYPNLHELNTHTWVGADFSLNLMQLPDIPQENQIGINPKNLPIWTPALEIGFSPWRKSFRKGKGTFMGLQIKFLNNIYLEYREQPVTYYKFKYQLPNIFIGYDYSGLFFKLNSSMFNREKHSDDRPSYTTIGWEFYGSIELGISL
jgi:hypothetical protein